MGYAYGAAKSRGTTRSNTHAATPDRIKSMLDITLRCKLSYKQEELLLSFQEQFITKGTLSDKQVAILEDIYEKAGGTND